MGALEAVWQAREPQAIIALRDAHSAAMSEWFAKVKALIVEADPEHGDEREIWTTRGFSPSRQLAGFGSYPKTVPDGWRVDNRGRLLPRRTGTIGKAWAAKFDALHRAPLDIRDQLPGGMPSHAFSGLSVHSPGIDFLDDGRVFIYWAHDPTDLGPDPGNMVRAPQIDPDVWTRVKLSDYYAAKGQ